MGRGRSFREEFPNIFQLAVDPLSSVVRCYNSKRRIWDPSLRRALNDWEISEILSLLEILGSLQPKVIMWIDGFEN